MTEARRIELLTVPLQEAARLIGGNPRHAYAMVRNGTWPTRTIRLGTRILVPRTEITRLIEGEGNGHDPQEAA